MMAPIIFNDRARRLDNETGLDFFPFTAARESGQILKLFSAAERQCPVRRTNPFRAPAPG